MAFELLVLWVLDCDPAVSVFDDLALSHRFFVDSVRVVQHKVVDLVGAGYPASLTRVNPSHILLFS